MSSDKALPFNSELAAEAGALLVERGEFLAVAESSAGGFISATLLSVPGASAFYLGGAVVYTGRSRGLVFERDALPPETRGATEDFAQRLALGARAKMRSEWGLAETGASGPSGNPYGDPAGHAWVCVARPDGSTATRHLLTGSDDRAANMVAYTDAAIELLVAELRS